MLRHMAATVNHRHRPGAEALRLGGHRGDRQPAGLHRLRHADAGRFGAAAAAAGRALRGHPPIGYRLRAARGGGRRDVRQPGRAFGAAARAGARHSADDAGIACPAGASTPPTIKKSVVGRGMRGEVQVQAMIRGTLLQADTKSADAADALVIAICHAHHASSAGSRPAHDRQAQRIDRRTATIASISMRGWSRSPCSTKTPQALPQGTVVVQLDGGPRGADPAHGFATEASGLVHP